MLQGCAGDGRCIAGRASDPRAAAVARLGERRRNGEWLGSERREAGTGGSSAAPISGGVGAVCVSVLMCVSIVASTRVTLD